MSLSQRPAALSVQYLDSTLSISSPVLPNLDQRQTEDATEDSHSSDDINLDISPIIDDEEAENLKRQFPFAAEPSYFLRPNRWHGPASTWRTYTAEDRAIVESLEAEENHDLSRHLLAVYKLKQYLNDKRHEQALIEEASQSRSRSQSRARRKGKARAVPGNDDERDLDYALSDDDQTDGGVGKPGVPDLWTAWPLPANSMPNARSADTGSVPSGSKSDLQPSANLEDALAARTLCLARARWDMRTQDSNPRSEQPPTIVNSKRNWQQEKARTTKELIESGVLKQENRSRASEGDSSDNNDHEQEVLDIDHVESDAADTDLEEQTPLGVQTFSSQAFGTISSSEESEREEPVGDRKPRSDEEVMLKPTFLADDGKAREILHPTLRHALSRLDDLLLGLHTARKAYAHRLNSDSDTSGRLSRSQSRARSKSRSRARSRLRTKKTSTDHKDIDHENSKSVQHSDLDASSRTRRGQVKPSHRPPKLFKPRDWSDVLGIACLAGWDREVVGRAAERCAKLFDQNMTFRTFHDSTILTTAAADPGAQFHPNMAPMTSRHNLQRKRKRAGWTSSMEESYAYVSPRQTFSTPELTSQRALPTTSRPLHNGTGSVPEPSTVHILPHRPINSISRPSSSEPSDSSTLLTCPVETCPRNISSRRTRKPFTFSRATRLYAHIAKAHPDYDLQRFKDDLALRRGEKRGRYQRTSEIRRSASRKRRRKAGESASQDGSESDGGHENSEEADENRGSSGKREKRRKSASSAVTSSDAGSTQGDDIELQDREHDVRKSIEQGHEHLEGNQGDQELSTDVVMS